MTKGRLVRARAAARQFRPSPSAPVGYTREELHAFGGRLVIAAALWDANGHPSGGPTGPAEFTFDNYGRVDAVDADGNKWEYRDGAWKREEPKA